MEKNNSSVVLNVILILLVLGLGGYIVYDKVLSDNTEDKEITDNKYNDDKISNNPLDYIALEDADFNNEDVKVQKVTFKNLDDSVTNKYLDKQNELLESVKRSIKDNDTNTGEIYTYSASTHIWYQINNNILTIHYTLNTTDLIGDCMDVITTNVDLENNKVLSNEDVLKLVNYSFNEIAVKEYEDKFKLFDDNNTYLEGKDNKRITKEDYINNKVTYVNTIENGLEDIVYAYIENGVVKYDYVPYDVNLLYLLGGKGGCFPTVTETAGYLK